jgi:hypothetical protein
MERILQKIGRTKEYIRLIESTRNSDDSLPGWVGEI